MVTGIRPPGKAKWCGTWRGISLLHPFRGIDTSHLLKFHAMATGQLSGVLRFPAKGSKRRLHPWSRSAGTLTGQEEPFPNGGIPVPRILFCLWNLVTDQLLVHVVARDCI